MDQTPEMGVRFVERYKLDIPVYRLSGQVLRELGVKSLPTNLLLDREGRPVMIQRGYSPEVPGHIRDLVAEMEGGPDQGSESSDS